MSRPTPVMCERSQAALALSRPIPVIKEAATTAAKVLGYAQIKEKQMKIIEAFAEGSDVFGVLPTGYGKSLCYACLPLIFDKLLQKPHGSSIAVVVSPLVAICKDQVSQSLQQYTYTE